MRKSLHDVRLLLLDTLTILVACSMGSCEDPARRSGNDADVETAAEHDVAEGIGIGMLEHVAVLVNAHKGDCDAMGREVSDYYQINTETVARIKLAYETMAEESRRALQRRYHDRFHTAWSTIRGGLRECGADARIRTVNQNIAMPARGIPKGGISH